VGQRFHIVEASRSHSDTPQSVGILWVSDQPDTETSTSHYTTLTRDKHPCPCPRWDSNPQSQQENGRRRTSRIIFFTTSTASTTTTTTTFTTSTHLRYHHYY